MPKKLLIISLLVSLIICTTSVVSMAEENIKLMVNDNLVTNDLDYQIVDQNILVPLHVLTDNLDVKVKWFSSIETLQLEGKDAVIKLRVGDRNLQVNNKLLKLPVSAQLINGQPMVPLKALGSALGLVIKSDPKNRIVKILKINSEVQEVDYQKKDDYEGVKIEVTEKVDYEVDLLHNPDRIVLDLKGTALNKKVDKIKLNSKLIKQVRMAQFNSNTTRLVLDLFDNVNYKVEKRKQGKNYQYFLKVSSIITDIKYDRSRIKLKATRPLGASSISYLSNPNRAVIDIKNAALKKGQKLKVNSPFIKQVRLSQYRTEPNNIVRVVLDLKEKVKISLVNEDNSLLIMPVHTKMIDIDYSQKQAEKLFFKLTNQIKPKVIPLQKGNRLVFDFPATINQISRDEINVNNKLIKKIRISQYNKNQTRVVVDLTKLVPYQLEWKDNTLQVKLMNRLLGIDLKEKELKTELNLSLLSPRSYKVHKLVNPSRLVVDINNTIVNPQEIKLPKKVGDIKDIRVSQYSTDPQQVRVVLELNEDFYFKSKSDSVSQNLAIELRKSEFKENLKDKVIVVDAGHGGHDPGALGFSGTREKNIVLDIALKLEELLEESGAKVVMTRKTDQFIELEDRTKLSNRLDADIFVSVHVNAHKDDQHIGTETYVAPNSDEYALLLAHFTQRYLIKDLETFDRGVKKNGLYVLNHTEMPAILSEIAFISNSKEEKLLMKDKFKDKAAIALYKGINKYFKLLQEEEF